MLLRNYAQCWPEGVHSMTCFPFGALLRMPVGRMRWQLIRCLLFLFPAQLGEPLTELVVVGRWPRILGRVRHVLPRAHDEVDS